MARQTNIEGENNFMDTLKNVFAPSEDDAATFLENVFRLGSAAIEFIIANPISWLVFALVLLKGSSIKLGKNQQLKL